MIFFHSSSLLALSLNKLGALSLLCSSAFLPVILSQNITTTDMGEFEDSLVLEQWDDESEWVMETWDEIEIDPDETDTGNYETLADNGEHRILKTPAFSIEARASGSGAKANAFDGRLRTKWVDNSSRSWIGIKFNQGKRFTVSNYEISSANNFPARDPKSWILFGSNDGRSWSALDYRSGVIFPRRLQTKKFNTNNNKAYNRYRLRIRDTNGANALQIAEIKLNLKESDKPAPTCSGSKKLVTVALKTDNYPTDTSWKLVNQANGRLIDSASRSSYSRNEEVEENYCLNPNNSYRFTIKDSYGDGLCCKYGQGYYKISVDGREIISGGKNMKKEESHLIFPKNNPPNPGPGLSARDREWLTAHNVRRKEWHERHNKPYVPLKWSAGLKADAKAYAEVLKNSCQSPLKHASGTGQGENLARNTGTGSFAKKPSADQVLTRFVEREQGLGYPQNGHLTQVIWRATHYVGCGESVKQLSNGRTCHTQVCRYVKAGNCNMKNFNNWKVPMLADDSPCGTKCPPEGCF